jgi:hypothetical protein
MNYHLLLEGSFGCCLCFRFQFRQQLLKIIPRAQPVQVGVLFHERDVPVAIGDGFLQHDQGPIAVGLAQFLALCVGELGIFSHGKDTLGQQARGVIRLIRGFQAEGSQLLGE